MMQDGFHQIDTGGPIWLSRNAFARIRVFRRVKDRLHRTWKR